MVPRNAHGPQAPWTGVMTLAMVPGCQVTAAPTSAKAPSRTMKAWAAPPSSAGQP